MARVDEHQPELTFHRHRQPKARQRDNLRVNTRGRLQEFPKVRARVARREEVKKAVKALRRASTHHRLRSVLPKRRILVRRIKIGGIGVTMEMTTHGENKKQVNMKGIKMSLLKPGIKTKKRREKKIETTQSQIQT